MDTPSLLQELESTIDLNRLHSARIAQLLGNLVGGHGFSGRSKQGQHPLTHRRERKSLRCRVGAGAALYRIGVDGMTMCIWVHAAGTLIRIMSHLNLALTTWNVII